MVERIFFAFDEDEIERWAYSRLSRFVNPRHVLENIIISWFDEHYRKPNRIYLEKDYLRRYVRVVLEFSFENPKDLFLFRLMNKGEELRNGFAQFIMNIQDLSKYAIVEHG